VHISSAFDSGNIEVVDATDPGNITLRIRRDAGDDHMQWFHFRVAGARGQALTLRLVNAKEASYPVAWNNYNAAASYDREYWFRAPTTYEDGALVIRGLGRHGGVALGGVHGFGLLQVAAPIAARRQVRRGAVIRVGRGHHEEFIGFGHVPSLVAIEG
jgi:hypothetical protein